MAKSKKNLTENQGLSRRALLTSSGLGILGSAFVGSNLLAREQGSPCGQPAAGGVTGVAIPPFQKKPVVLPSAQSRDVVEHARAEMLFWNDIMMEHSLFLAILMPTADVSSQRNQALQFKNSFATQISRLKAWRLDRSSLATVARSNNDMVRRLHDFKLQAREDQLAGRIHTLVWPLFFTHTAREADRFAKRVDNISRGNLELDASEVVDFWTSTMGEHAQFISHLLDPEEMALIQKADDTAKAFFAAKQSAPSALEPLATEIINFKEAAEDGIVSGKIKSIILPSLADHVRREAIKFADELKRV
jgi:hypothetical protein